MNMDNFIRLGLVSASYIILVFGLGYIMLHYKQKHLSYSDRILSYFVSGNFYIMNVIYILLFLKCTSRIITVCVLLLGAILIRYLIDPKSLVRFASEKLGMFARLAEGVYGWNLFVHRKKITYKERSHLFNKLVFRRYFIEILGVAGCLAIQAYYMGYRYIKYYSFGLSDEFAHLEWIQSMLNGRIFLKGIYPFGYHNINYAIIKVFGFHAYTATRFFGFIMVMCMMLMMYLLIKKLYRSAYAPLAGLFLYVGANIFTDSAWDRMQVGLPQEFSMMFVFPLAIFLYRYIKEKQKIDLVLFTISYVLTLYTHYYATIIGLVLCACIGICNFYRMVKERILHKILLYGIIGTVIGIIPMGIGVAAGYGIQGSFRWAVGVMQGNPEDLGEEAEDDTQEPGQTQGEETQDTTIDQDDSSESVRDDALTPSVGSILSSMGQRISSVFRSIRNSILTVYFTIQAIVTAYLIDETIFRILMINCILIMMKFIISCIRRTKELKTLLQLSVMIFMILLMLMFCSQQIGLPVIMQSYRISSIMSMTVPLLIGIPLEYFYELLEKRKWSRYLANTMILAATGICVIGVYQFGYTRQLGRFVMQNSESAVKTYYNIIDEYEDYNWTIVSSGQEYGLCLDVGFHTELIDLLKEFEINSSFSIPSQYVFIFIEKRPILVGNSLYVYIKDGIGTLPTWSLSDANNHFAFRNLVGTSDDYVVYRSIIMAKSYEWAEAYRKYFPKEMTIFYEDDDFICYRLVQETDYPNDLKINY